MKGEWITKRIGDLGRVVTGKTPPTADPENFGGPYPFITIPDLSGRVLIDRTERTLSEKGAELLSACLLPQGSVMMSCIATVGRCGITAKPSFTNQQINSVIPNESVDARFLYYVFTQLGYELESAGSGGSVYTNVSKSRFASLEVTIPKDLGEQRAIAHILGTLDDKIEVNRKMCQTLEEMARALFKSWFIDFDPVRAKAAVRRAHPNWTNAQVSRTACPNLKPEIAELFPDRFVDSELGEIPEGWEVKAIKDCCVRVQNGGTPRRDEPKFWVNGDIPWLTSGEVRQPIITSTEGFITKAGLTSSSAKWVDPLSTVVALYGATAGQVSLVSMRLTTNQAICSLIPKDGYAFLNYLNMRNAISNLVNKAVGSAQQNISKAIVEETQIIVPPFAVIEGFNHIVELLFIRWISSLHQSRTLAALRDALLPKLISGQIRVKDAERFLKERGL